MTFTLTQLQAEQRPWVKHNFGDRPSWMPLSGLSEEYGELLEAETREDRLDATGDIIIFLCDYCSSQGLELQELQAATVNQCGTLGDIESIGVYIGRLHHHHLKREQGIRGTKEEHEANIRDWVAFLWWAIDEYCYTAFNEDAFWIAKETWYKVKQRDWTKDKKS